MRTLSTGFLLFLAVQVPLLGAKYKIKDLQLKAPTEYAAHQDFQGIAIGAYPCDTLERTLEIFDTEKLHEKGILPVLITVDNRNSYAVKISEREIFLIEANGARSPSLHYTDVLLEITLKDPLSGFASKKELLLVKKEMYIDFESKAFREKEVAGGESVYGVVFYRRPQKLQGCRLFLPEITRVETGEALVFFEFDLFPQE